MPLYSMKIELCIDKIPPRWIDVFHRASPGKRWVMLTNAHMNNMDVSFGDYEVKGYDGKAAQADQNRVNDTMPGMPEGGGNPV